MGGARIGVAATVCALLMGCSLVLDDLSSSRDLPPDGGAPASSHETKSSVVDAGIMAELVVDAGPEALPADDDDPDASLDADGSAVANGPAGDAGASCKTPAKSSAARVARSITTTAADAGASAWANVGAGASPDGLRAAASLSMDVRTNALELRDFGMSVPADAIILGVTIEVTRQASGGVEDDVVQLFFGATASQNRASGPWPAATAVKAYGGTTFRWGLRWLSAHVNSPAFGVRIVAKAGVANSSIAYLDGVRVVVHYCQ